MVKFIQAPGSAQPAHRQRTGGRMHLPWQAMRKNLHHLNALRSFEAAARQLSFTNAAHELCVTQAAISHQIRALEQSLGTQLFERRPRQVRLTVAGEQLLAVLSDSFDGIERVLASLGNPQVSTLQLAVTPTFSSKWLMPRLPRFIDRHPDIELHLHHTAQADVLTRGQVDMAVIWTTRPPPRLWARRLFGTALTPVCSPALERPEHPLSQPSAVCHYPLLHEDGPQDWQRWLTHVGLSVRATRRGLVIDDSNALLTAAMAGRGIALGRLALIADDLRSGRLVRPFAQTIEAEGAYWLIAQPSMVAQPRFRSLAQFLMDSQGDPDAAPAQPEPASPPPSTT
ncbi:LysR family transcriptional regulator [Verminephrobacter eiseniae]|nr:LysR family transcriptional regulator [Verminephrobacter eiseniae]